MLERKEKLERKKAAIPYSEIQADDSPGKSSTHHKLLDYLLKHGENAFIAVYLKPQLQNICKAYGVTGFNAKTSKKDLAKALFPAMKASQRMLYPLCVCNLHVVNIRDVGERITMRIRAFR